MTQKTPKQCVILCGGRGTRLGDLVSDTPKPMLRVHDRPFLCWQIAYMLKFCLTNFLLLAGYLGDVIREYFNTCPDFTSNAKITVLCEPKPLGTCGALRFAAPYLEENFFLLNGDSICIFDLHKVSAPLDQDTLARIAVMPMTGSLNRYGNIKLEGGLITSFAEKDLAQDKDNLYINAGVYYMQRSILDAMPEQASSLEKDIFPNLAQKKQLAGTLVDPKYFIDIGIPQDFYRAQKELPLYLA